jgi:hypothetical protein
MRKILVLLSRVPRMISEELLASLGEFAIVVLFSFVGL